MEVLREMVKQCEVNNNKLRKTKNRRQVRGGINLGERIIAWLGNLWDCFNCIKPSWNSDDNQPPIWNGCWKRTRWRYIDNIGGCTLNFRNILLLGIAKIDNKLKKGQQNPFFDFILFVGPPYLAQRNHFEVVNHTKFHRKLLIKRFANSLASKQKPSDTSKSAQI